MSFAHAMYLQCKYAHVPYLSTDKVDIFSIFSTQKMVRANRFLPLTPLPRNTNEGRGDFGLCGRISKMPLPLGQKNGGTD
jgi:hypothetical protein